MSGIGTTPALPTAFCLIFIMSISLLSSSPLSLLVSLSLSPFIHIARRSSRSNTSSHIYKYTNFASKVWGTMQKKASPFSDNQLSHQQLHTNCEISTVINDNSNTWITNKTHNNTNTVSNDSPTRHYNRNLHMGKFGRIWQNMARLVTNYFSLCICSRRLWLVLFGCFGCPIKIIVFAMFAPVFHGPDAIIMRFLAHYYHCMYIAVRYASINPSGLH